MPQAVDGTLRKFALRVPEVIYQCSGIMVFGKRINRSCSRPTCPSSKT